MRGRFTVFVVLLVAQNLIELICEKLKFVSQVCSNLFHFSSSAPTMKLNVFRFHLILMMRLYLHNNNSSEKTLSYNFLPRCSPQFCFCYFCKPLQLIKTINELRKMRFNSQNWKLLFSIKGLQNEMLVGLNFFRYEAYHIKLNFRTCFFCKELNHFHQANLREFDYFCFPWTLKLFLRRRAKLVRNFLCLLGTLSILIFTFTVPKKYLRIILFYTETKSKIVSL